MDLVGEKLDRVDRVEAFDALAIGHALPLANDEEDTPGVVLLVVADGRRGFVDRKFGAAEVAAGRCSDLEGEPFGRSGPSARHSFGGRDVDAVDRQERRLVGVPIGGRLSHVHQCICEPLAHRLIATMQV